VAFRDETAEAKERSGGPLCLVAVSDEHMVSKDLPETGALIIGRDPDADLPLPHPEVSRRHARLLVGPIQRLEDLGSANGTRLRGERLKPNHPALIEPGETAVIGPYLLALKARRVRRASEVRPRGSQAIFASRAMVPVLERIDKVARGQISVLLLGETGTGKEVLAERIHQLSTRSGGPLVRVNCAAISPQLFESELFGHERGAFTGAESAKAGLLEAADGGTLFLDEVGDLPEGVQAKFLRVIEQREVVRVGSTQARRVDVRFVSATNRNLAEDAKAGRFRGDLFFRLSGISVAIPPLRDRPEDVQPLARSFADRFAAELGLGPVAFSVEALAWLENHDWPGNVRELRNRIERAVLLQSSGTLEPDHLRDELEERMVSPPSADPPAAGGSRDEEWHQRRRQIVEALSQAGGNQKAAAGLLGVDRKTLGRYLDKYEIPRPRKS
jgi:transcriptional regulator with PAS, ATPase and Fis domain